MAKEDRLRVLMELRPALDEFAGIPQETRLEFLALSMMKSIEVTGLINHPSRTLWPGIKRGYFARLLSPHRKMHTLARAALSVKVDPMETLWDRVLHYASKRVSTHYLSFMAHMRIGLPLYEFEAGDFGDFVWQSMFSKTLAAKDFQVVHNARYAILRQPHDLLSRIAIKKMRLTGLPGMPVKISTRNYDVFVSQTPFPTELSRKTQLVVRYHDAVPILMPHTIKNARFHQHVHMANLLQNSRKGLFACVSEATRSDLLKIFPKLENRSVVIPDIVSHEYYPEVGNQTYIANIIRNHIRPDTEPKFLTSREKENFYVRHLNGKTLRYLLMVSTLEPRKNYPKMISAWDYLKNHGMTDLKLVIVGQLGWEYSRILESMAPWQQRGELFHLHCVPSGKLRVLYNGAAAVVCPSVAEGFDLSGIEAMLCGGAVVASEIPVHREIYQNACRYFDPYSTLSQAKAIESVIHPDCADNRKQLIEAGLKLGPSYRRESIEHAWYNFFDRIRSGAFKKISEEEITPDPNFILPEPNRFVFGGVQLPGATDETVHARVHAGEKKVPVNGAGPGIYSEPDVAGEDEFDLAEDQVSGIGGYKAQSNNLDTDGASDPVEEGVL